MWHSLKYKTVIHQMIVNKLAKIGVSLRGKIEHSRGSCETEVLDIIDEAFEQTIATIRPDIRPMIGTVPDEVIEKQAQVDAQAMEQQDGPGEQQRHQEAFYHQKAPTSREGRTPRDGNSKAVKTAAVGTKRGTRY